MKLRKLLIILIAIFYVFIAYTQVNCNKLCETLHFTVLDSNLKLLDGINNDVGYNNYTARFFHNKVQVYLAEFFNKYLHFWDIQFGILFFSLIGYFGILYGFWHIAVNEKNYERLFYFLLILFVPLLEIFQVPGSYKLRYILIFVFLGGFSLYGIWQFLGLRKRFGFLIIITLFLLSIYLMYISHNKAQI